MREKWIAKSMTFWGLIISIAPSAATLMGWDFSPEDAEALDLAGRSLGQALIEFAGLVIALVGRFRAQSKVTILPTKAQAGGTAGVLLACVFLAACSTSARDVLQSAETPGQKAGAIYGLWVTTQEAAADLVVLPETPDAVVVAIADAELAAKPIVDQLQTTYLEYLDLKAEMDAAIEAGEAVEATTLQQMEAIIVALQEAINAAEPKVNGFRAVVTTNTS